MYICLRVSVRVCVHACIGVCVRSCEVTFTHCLVTDVIIKVDESAEFVHKAVRDLMLLSNLEEMVRLLACWRMLLLTHLSH